MTPALALTLAGWKSTPSGWRHPTTGRVYTLRQALAVQRIRDAAAERKAVGG